MNSELVGILVLLNDVQPSTFLCSNLFLACRPPYARHVPFFLQPSHRQKNTMNFSIANKMNDLGNLSNLGNLGPLENLGNLYLFEL